VRVVFHAGAHDVGDLVELAVVHLEKGVEDAPLHGLQAVSDVGDRPVLDDIGGVVEEVVVEDLAYVGHGPRPSGMLFALDYRLSKGSSPLPAIP
jgi:hypothetical protein